MSSLLFFTISLWMSWMTLDVSCQLVTLSPLVPMSTTNASVIPKWKHSVCRNNRYIFKISLELELKFLLIIFKEMVTLLYPCLIDSFLAHMSQRLKWALPILLRSLVSIYNWIKRLLLLQFSSDFDQTWYMFIGPMRLIQNWVRIRNLTRGPGGTLKRVSYVKFQNADISLHLTSMSSLVHDRAFALFLGDPAQSNQRFQIGSWSFTFFYSPVI